MMQILSSSAMQFNWFNHQTMTWTKASAEMTVGQSAQAFLWWR
jgi:hypothetical protein